MILRQLAVAILVTAAAVPATSWDGDPATSCRDVLNESDGIAPAVDWVAGYIAGRTRIAMPANRMTIDTAIAAAYVVDRARPLAAIAEDIAVMALARLPYLAPGTPEGAVAMLRAFYDPTADHYALTDALRPTDEEIGLVFDDELAKPLRLSIANTFGEGEAIEPFADDVDVEVFVTTTDKLIGGDAEALAAFAADYARVVEHLKPGFPIATFRFFAIGPVPGKAFDGLIHVNGHWVLISEPWTVLDDDGGGR